MLQLLTYIIINDIIFHTNQVFSQQKEPDMSIPHIESKPPLVQVARNIHERWTEWEKLTATADNLLKSQCPPPQPGEEPTCCQIHMALHNMLLRLHEQAAVLEDKLSDLGLARRRDILFGEHWHVLTIIDRLDTGYSFQRFSPGGFEMIRHFFPPEETAIVAA